VSNENKGATPRDDIEQEGIVEEPGRKKEMKILYIDAGMGAAGDMLTGALLELVPDKEVFIKKINEIGIPKVKVSVCESVKCGITGTHINVRVDGVSEEDHHHDHHHEGDDHDHSHEHDGHNHGHDGHHHDHDHHHNHDDHNHNHHHDHHHSSMADIERIVDSLNVSASVKSNVKKVYALIAEAESVAHNKPVTDIHFHEVGTMDAIADVTAVCMLMEEINPDKVICSPVHVGSGHVHCAHGILPVPAPATAYILKDCPIYSGHIQGELCTPTGAALLKHFSDEFGSMPPMTLKLVGYGMGFKDFEQANCVRVMLGESFEATTTVSGIMDFNNSGCCNTLSEYTNSNSQAGIGMAFGNLNDNDTIVILECNIDDMTPEDISYAKDMLFKEGAREVFSNTVHMKKNRDGVMLTTICSPEDKDRIVECIFKNTSTIGIRERVDRRYVLSREVEEYNTMLGLLKVKKSSGYGVTKIKPEYDELVRIAKEHDWTMEETRRAVADIVRHIK